MEHFYFVGQILLLPIDYAPADFAACDGKLLKIGGEFLALFSLIGTKFGGDGATTFALPNYSGLAPSGSKYYIALQGRFPPRP